MLLSLKRSKPLNWKLLLPLLKMELPSKKLPMLEMLLLPKETSQTMHRPKPSNKLLKLLLPQLKKPLLSMMV
jgi:Trp operon repressor